MFEVKYCVCTEQADGYGYSMAIIEKFDSYEEAESFILNGSGLYASFYYIKKLYIQA